MLRSFRCPLKLFLNLTAIPRRILPSLSPSYSKATKTISSQPAGEEVLCLGALGSTPPCRPSHTCFMPYHFVMLMCNTSLSSHTSF